MLGAVEQLAADGVMPVREGIRFHDDGFADDSFYRELAAIHLRRDVLDDDPRLAHRRGPLARSGGWRVRGRQEKHTERRQAQREGVVTSVRGQRSRFDHAEVADARART